MVDYQVETSLKRVFIYALHCDETSGAEITYFTFKAVHANTFLLGAKRYFSSLTICYFHTWIFPKKLGCAVSCSPVLYSASCDPPGCVSPVEESLTSLTDAVYELTKLYLQSFCSATPGCTMEEHMDDGRDSKEASGTTEHLQFTLFAVHGIPATWVSR